MSRAEAHILELFEKLSDDEQRRLARQLYERTRRGAYYDTLSAEQRVQLAGGLAEADRGDVVDAQAAMDGIAKRLGFERA